MIELRSILKEVYPKLHISDKGIEKAKKDHLTLSSLEDERRLIPKQRWDPLKRKHTLWERRKEKFSVAWIVSEISF